MESLAAIPYHYSYESRFNTLVCVVVQAQQADGVRRPIICPKPRLGPLRFDGTSEDVSRLDSRCESPSLWSKFRG